MHPILAHVVEGTKALVLAIVQMLGVPQHKMFITNNTPEISGVLLVPYK